MIVYRIAAAAFVQDLSGEGAYLYGGRWTAKGIRVLYTSENRALAAMELYAHVGIGRLVPSLKLATIDIPDTSLRTLDCSALPANWNAYPAPLELLDIGQKWISSGEFILKVPSVHVPSESNLILNVAHPDMRKVKLVDIIEYRYDRRLCRPSPSLNNLLWSGTGLG